MKSFFGLKEGAAEKKANHPQKGQQTGKSYQSLYVPSKPRFGSGIKQKSDCRGDQMDEKLEAKSRPRPPTLLAENEGIINQFLPLEQAKAELKQAQEELRKAQDKLTVQREKCIKKQHFADDQGSSEIHPYPSTISLDWKAFAKIGQGGNGQVFKTTFEGCTVAIKVNLCEDDEKEAFNRECAMLRLLSHHPSAVKFFGSGTFADNRYHYIIQEYCPGKDLYANLLELNLKQKYDVAVQLAHVVAFIHSQGFIHRDLKSLNVMVNKLPEEAIQIKLIDFGLSRKVSEKMTASMCTYKWMAPEMTNQEHYDEKCDVYSYGVVLHELLYGRTPFKSYNKDTLFREKLGLIFSWEYLSKEEQEDAIFMKLWTLMCNCLKVDPCQRMSFESIVLFFTKKN